MQKGDIVTIIDGSQATRVDQYEEYTSIGLCKDDFLVINVIHNNYIITKTSKTPMHDIFIKNIRTNNIYLHTKAFVRVIRPVEPVRELTIDDIERKYGCKVKIVK